MTDDERREVFRLIAFLQEEARRTSSFGLHLQGRPRSKTAAAEYAYRAKMFKRSAELLQEKALP